VRAVLVTGMSGTGKSTALAALRARGFETVDTDEPGRTAGAANVVISRTTGSAARRGSRPRSEAV
jgi:dephospho-CoA kinase